MTSPHEVSIVFLSPHGSTRQVADKIRSVFSEAGFRIGMHDLRGKGKTEIRKLAQNMKPGLLAVGSPIYLDHILEPLVYFIKSLSKQDPRRNALLFTTFGATSTGVAMQQASRLLIKKKFRVIGAADVVAEHTLMFQGTNPLGKGHPSPGDLDQVGELVKSIIGKLEQKDVYPLRLSNMKPIWYKWLCSLVFNMDSLGKSFPAIDHDSSKCTECGACESHCTLKIVKNKQSEDGFKCIKCYECVRVCPNGCYRAPLKEFEWKILRKKSLVSSFDVDKTIIYN